MVDYQTYFELEDPTLGRLVARRWTLGAISDVGEIREEGLSADEYAARVLAAVIRSVPGDAHPNRETFDAGTLIEPSELAQLPPGQLESLCGSYLQVTEKSMVPPSNVESGAIGGPPDPTSITPKAGGRETERLQRLVGASLAWTEKAFAETAKLMHSALSAGLAPDLTAAFDRTSRLSESIGSALSGLRVAGKTGFGESIAKLKLPGIDGAVSASDTKTVESALSRVSRPESLEAALWERLPPNPVHQTNAELAELITTIRQLVEIGQRQAELSQALTETSQLALRESMNSAKTAENALRQARNSVRIAILTLVLSAIVGGTGIYQGYITGGSTDARLERLIDAVQQRGKTARPAVDPNQLPHDDKASERKLTPAGPQVPAKRSVARTASGGR